MIHVSHAAADAELAARIARDLRARELDVRATEGAGDGSDPVLAEGGVLLVLLSPEATSSPRVIAEITLAIEEDAPLVPALLRECPIPERLRKLIRADFGADYAEALEALVRQLEATPDGPAPVPVQAAREAVARAEGATVAAPVGASPGSLAPRERMSRLAVTAHAGLAGGATAGIGELLIYADDVRIGTETAPSLSGTVLGGALVGGLLWAWAGSIAGARKLPLQLALTGSLAGIAAWVAIGGTYADVMGAAVVVGGPSGGILGALIGRGIEVARRDEDDAGGLTFGQGLPERVGLLWLLVLLIGFLL